MLPARSRRSPASVVSPRRLGRIAGLLVALALGFPIVAAGQSPAPNSIPPIPTPNDPPTTTSAPHPMMPWSPYAGPDVGEPVRAIPVPPQQITIDVLVPAPASLPSRTEPRVVEIPGYFVTETTTGYVFPERWTLDRLNVGVYQWRKLPAEFRKK